MDEGKWSSGALLHNIPKSGLFATLLVFAPPLKKNGKHIPQIQHALYASNEAM